MFSLIIIKEIEIKQWDAFYSSEIADLNKMSLPKVMEGSAFGEQFDLCQIFLSIIVFITLSVRHDVNGRQGLSLGILRITLLGTF